MKLYGFLILLVFCQSISAQTQYPELQVSPRASERVRLEASLEKRYHWRNHLPLTIASTATLVSGILTSGDHNEKKDSSNVASKIGISVGAAWLATSIYLQMSYRPYLATYSLTKNLPQGSIQEQLTRERLCEEAMNEAGTLARKIKWLSFGSNLASSVYMFSVAKGDSAAKGASAVAVITSFATVLFPYRWELVSEEQQNYKKRIFGPVTMNHGLLHDKASNKYLPGIIASTEF